MVRTLSTFLFLILAPLSFASTAKMSDVTDPLSRDTFSFHEPTANDLGSKVTLWGTYYYLPQMNDNSGAYSIRNMKGEELGPQLSLSDWCNSALEGSVRIVNKEGVAKTFNYAGVTSDHSIDCKKIFKPDVSKTKFREAVGPYGDGLDEYILSPYRTIATDQTKMPIGTVLYIPAARGAQIKLANGRKITHDGYFFSGDKGGAIKDNHIDVFIGTDSSANYFPWIKSNATKTFEAYIVTDKTIIAELNDLHLPK